MKSFARASAVPNFLKKYSKDDDNQDIDDYLANFEFLGVYKRESHNSLSQVRQLPFKDGVSQ